jgi:hypothetical protein
MFDIGLIIGVVFGLCAGAFVYLVDSHCFHLVVEANAKRGIPEKIGKHWYKLTIVDEE